MKPPRPSNDQIKGLRLLVFVCFLNFSGLNNGYTYLTVVSPLSVQSSVSLTGSVAKCFYSVLAVQDIFKFLDQGHHWVTKSTLRAESILKSCLKLQSASIPSGYGETRLSVRSLNRFQQGDQILSDRNENYIKGKESWIKDGYFFTLIARSVVRTAGLKRSARRWLDWIFPNQIMLKLKGQRTHFAAEEDAPNRTSSARCIAPDFYTRNRVFIFRRVKA